MALLLEQLSSGWAEGQWIRAGVSNRRPLGLVASSALQCSLSDHESEGAGSGLQSPDTAEWWRNWFSIFIEFDTLGLDWSCFCHRPDCDCLAANVSSHWNVLFCMYFQPNLCMSRQGPQHLWCFFFFWLLLEHVFQRVQICSKQNS